MTFGNRLYTSDAKLREKRAPTEGDPMSMPRAATEGEVKAGSGKTYGFIVSTGAVDHARDTIDQSGWSLDGYKRNPVVLWAHNASMLPVGRAKSIAVVNGKLQATVEFAGTEMGQHVEKMVEQGFLRGTSVGFVPKVWKFNRERDGVDHIEQTLLEFSLCPIPCNSECLRVRTLTPAEKQAERAADLARIKAEQRKHDKAERKRLADLALERRRQKTTPEQRQRQRERELELIKLKAGV